MAFSLAKSKPLNWQKEVLNDPTPYKVVVAHRSSGKSQLACIAVLTHLLACKSDNPLAIIIAPEKKQAAEIFIPKFRTLLKGVKGVKITSTQNEHSITFPDGRRIIMEGVNSRESILAMRGLSVDFLVWDEIGFINEEAYNALMPTLTRYDREAGKALFLGTPNGVNLFYKVYQYGLDPKSKYFKSFKYTVYDTQMFSDEQIQHWKDTNTKGVFEQEYMGEFFANSDGYYYSAAMKELRENKQVTTVPYNKNYLVNTAWDLGVSNDHIFFFQVYDNKVFVIDFKSEPKPKGLESTATMLKQLPYKYDRHYLPHDIIHKSTSTGGIRLTELKELLKGHGLISVTKKYGVQEGITSALKLLPSCYFDEVKCYDGLTSLENYQQKVVNGVMTDAPLHNEYSHAADAFRYLAVNTKLDTKTFTQQQSEYLNYDIFNPYATKSYKVDTEYNPFDGIRGYEDSV